MKSMEVSGKYVSCEHKGGGRADILVARPLALSAIVHWHQVSSSRCQEVGSKIEFVRNNKLAK